MMSASESTSAFDGVSQNDLATQLSVIEDLKNTLAKSPLNIQEYFLQIVNPLMEPKYSAIYLSTDGSW